MRIIPKAVAGFDVAKGGHRLKVAIIIKRSMYIASNLARRKLSELAIWMSRLFFCITVILIPFRFRYVLLARPAPPIYKDFTDFHLFLSDIAVLAIFVFWGLALLLERKPISPGPNFVWLPLVGLIFISLITSFTSLDVSLSLYHTLRLLALFLYYLYVVNEVRSRSIVVVAVAIQLIVQSLVALAQFLLQSSIGLKTFGEHTLDPAISGVSIVSTGVTRVLRSYGLTEHPNVLGGCLALASIILFAAYLHGMPNIRTSVALVMMLGLPALFVTFSRSAWLVFFMGAIILLGAVVYARGWRILKPVFWLALICLLVLAPLLWNYSGYIGNRLNVGGSFTKNPYENQSIGERLLLDKVGVSIFFDKPFTGIGLGGSALAIKKYFPDFHGNFVPPHLVLLTVAMEIGIFGLTFFIFLLVFPWAALIMNKVNILGNPMLLVASVLLMAMTLIGIFDIYPWLLPPGRLWQWLAWGLWSAAYDLREKNSATYKMLN